MKIRKISIKNFRGIKSLDWNLNPEDNFVCLIGHGDSTKSTILKSVEYALSPKWNLPLVDSDFHNCNPLNKIEIKITLGGLSDQLKTEFVGNYRYFNDGEFRALEEKLPTDEQVITAGIQIDESLDPFWFVCDSDGNIDEDDLLGVSSRKLFNLFRLDKESKNVFSWKYDSPLLKFIKKDKRKEIKSKLVTLGRTARDAFDINELPSEIKEQSDEIEKIARSLAVGHESFVPNVDIFSAESICLHKGEIPIYMLGDGSQRIISLAIGEYLVKKSKEEDFDGGFILFDEIENSLDPHRIRYITSSFLRNSSNSKFQTFLTTHSPIVVQELGTNGLYVVRNNDGVVSVHRISEDCISAVRSKPESLFSKKIIICEGNTEFGLLKAFSRYWALPENHKNPPAHMGATLLGGSGSSIGSYMKKFHSMGYEISIFKDNDADTSALTRSAQELGIPIFEYTEGFRTEKIVFKESPKELQDALINYYNLNKSDSEPLVEIKDKYAQIDINNFEELLHDAQRRDDQNRSGIFRNISRATEFGEIIIPFWDKFESTSNFKETINNIATWIYNE